MTRFGKKLSADGVKIHDYDEMISFVKGLSADEAVLLDPQKVNYAIDSSIQGKKVEKANPTQLAKAIKTRWNWRTSAMLISRMALRLPNLCTGSKPTWVKSHD